MSNPEPLHKKIAAWPHSIGERYLILLLAFVTLGVYYPAILGDFCYLDDLVDLQNSLNSSWGNLERVLGVGGAYQRWVANFIYYVIYVVAGDDPMNFHLANVLFHLGCGILIYFIVRNLQSRENTNLWPAFLAALVFLLHPVNVEAVAWIAGRNAVIATFFTLFTLLFHLKVKEPLKDWRHWIAVFCYLISILTYEIGIATLLFLVLWDLWKRKEVTISGTIKSQYKRWLPYAVVLLTWFLLRVLSFVWTGGEKGQFTNKLNSFDLQTIPKVVLNPIIGLGFYFKKMVFPWPLNFHIEHIAKVPYFLFGLALILLLIYGTRKRYWQALWGWGFVSGLLMVLPMTVVQFSWTHLAERYCYLASVFFAVLVALFFVNYAPLQSSSRQPLLRVVALVFVFIFGVSVVTRATVWQSNDALMIDTYKKSPDNGWVAFAYSAVFLSNGREKEAEAYLKKAISLGYVENSAMRLGMLAESREDYDQAEEYYLLAAWPVTKVRRFTRTLNPEVYKALGRLHLKWVGKDPENADKHYERAIHFYKRAYELSNEDPMILYNLGKVCLRQNNLEKAQFYFRQVSEQVPDTYYGKAAAKLMRVGERYQ